MCKKMENHSLSHRQTTTETSGFAPLHMHTFSSNFQTKTKTVRKTSCLKAFPRNYQQGLLGQELRIARLLCAGRQQAWWWSLMCHGFPRDQLLPLVTAPRVERVAHVVTSSHLPSLGCGILLFIFHANFLGKEVIARLCGPCSVQAVVLNDKFQLPVFLVRFFFLQPSAHTCSNQSPDGLFKFLFK